MNVEVIERRKKMRLPIQRQMRYKLIEDGEVIAHGIGVTIDLSSNGVRFSVGQAVKPGTFVELSISWPVVLDGETPMRLVTFGRIVRMEGLLAICSIDKYEFRTQARVLRLVEPVRADGVFQRWVMAYQMKTQAAAAACTA